MSDKPVILNAPTLKALTFLPLVSWPGRVHQAPDGTAWIIREDGGADPVIQGGQPFHRSVAADPYPGER